MILSHYIVPVKSLQLCEPQSSSQCCCSGLKGQIFVIPASWQGMSSLSVSMLKPVAAWLWLWLFIIIFLSPELSFTSGGLTGDITILQWMFQQSGLMLCTCINHSPVDDEQEAAGCQLLLLLLVRATLTLCVCSKHRIYSLCCKSVCCTVNIHTFKGAVHWFYTLWWVSNATQSGKLLYVFCGSEGTF